MIRNRIQIECEKANARHGHVPANVRETPARWYLTRLVWIEIDWNDEKVSEFKREDIRVAEDLVYLARGRRPWHARPRRHDVGDVREAF